MTDGSASRTFEASKAPAAVQRAWSVVLFAVRSMALLIGVFALIGGMVWLPDGGTEQWGPYLGIAGGIFVFGYLFLFAWWAILRVARRRWARQTGSGEGKSREDPIPASGWHRFEMAAVAAVLGLIAIGIGLFAAIVWGVTAVQRAGWDQAHGVYSGKEAKDPAECFIFNCPTHHRVELTDGSVVFVDAPGRTWSENTAVTVYIDPSDPERVEAPGSLELFAEMGLIVAAGLAIGALARSILKDRTRSHAVGSQPHPTGVG